MEERFDAGGTFTFRPGGISMLPYIRGGEDKVTIRRFEGNAKKYEVVFFRRDDGKYIMHRVVGKKGGEYLICGDNQWRKERVSEEKIFATECGVERNGRKIKKGSLYALYCRTLFVRRFYLRGINYIKKHILKK